MLYLVTCQDVRSFHLALYKAYIIESFTFMLPAGGFTMHLTAASSTLLVGLVLSGVVVVAAEPEREDPAPDSHRRQGRGENDGELKILC